MREQCLRHVCRQQHEVFEAAWLDRAKMSLVLGEKPWNCQSLGGGPDRGIRQANFQIAILREEFATTCQIRGHNWDKREILLVDRLKELKGGVRPEPRVQ